MQNTNMSTYNRVCQQQSEDKNQSDLDLDGISIQNLPNNIGWFSHVKILKLQGNQLTHLPPLIVNLKVVEEIYLDTNKFYTFPEPLYCLKTLKTISITHNSL